MSAIHGPIPERMNAWWLQLSRTESQLELRDTPTPKPQAHQVLVKMHAAALNRGEFVAGHGLHGTDGTWKAIGGEGSGQVVAVGGDVTRVHVGDEVFGRCSAAFSEYGLFDQAEVIAKPNHLSWTEAACISMTYLAAYDMLLLQGKLKAREWVLVNGITSGVGVATLQIAKALGARVIGTSVSHDKLKALAPMGLDLGVCTRLPDFSAAVLDATQSRGADLVINCVGGTVFAEELRCIAFQGRLAMVGYVDGVLEAPIDLKALHTKRLTLFGVSNKLLSKAQRAATIPGFVNDILPLFSNGSLQPVIDNVFPFDDLPEAKRHMESGKHIGKISLEIAGLR